MYAAKMYILLVININNIGQLICIIANSLLYSLNT